MKILSYTVVTVLPKSANAGTGIIFPSKGVGTGGWAMIENVIVLPENAQIKIIF